MLAVYVAGPYTGPNVGAVIANMRRGRALAVEARKAGFAVFCPWDDFEEAILWGDDDGDMVKCLQEGSLEWLERSDAMLIQSVGWRESKGTMAEYERALELEMPVFWHRYDLEMYASTMNSCEEASARMEAAEQESQRQCAVHDIRQPHYPDELSPWPFKTWRDRA